uniref:VQ domain-containing protein n=1 Tax=Chenopodium quinoa TaxID=63459 RepID=A0A803LFY0_CHEQI
MSSRSKLRQPMKVVHIKTQYVETDACSFKSVVQDLTGKDSTIAYAPSTSRVMKVSKEKISARPQSRLARTSHGLQTTNLSYKEMDRLLKEMPPLDDLHKVLSFD